MTELINDNISLNDCLLQKEVSHNSTKAGYLLY